jgi:hypothetical protein
LCLKAPKNVNNKNSDVSDTSAPASQIRERFMPWGIDNQQPRNLNARFKVRQIRPNKLFECFNREKTGAYVLRHPPSFASLHASFSKFVKK